MKNMMFYCSIVLITEIIDNSFFLISENIKEITLAFALENLKSYI